MGGRVSTMMASPGYPCSGLILAGYPLHPSGQPEKLRDGHLTAIPVPVLCMNGTKDRLCRLDLMERVAASLPTTWTMHWLEHADHSLKVLKRSGRTHEDVLAEVQETCTRWLEKIVCNPTS